MNFKEWHTAINSIEKQRPEWVSSEKNVEGVKEKFFAYVQAGYKDPHISIKNLSTKSEIVLSLEDARALSTWILKHAPRSGE